MLRLQRYPALCISLYARETATTPVAVKLACRLANGGIRVALVCPPDKLDQANGQSLGMLGIMLLSDFISPAHPALNETHDIIVIDNGTQRGTYAAHWVNLDIPNGDSWWLSML